ncbi:uncharacterized protein LOC124913401 [Impatiens glandulifera]|uniref:uncharacterized protein LOC124913401 n=1 Tax=Impatiens glandulifera TaxID=253017 RepID=UPI001FB0912B|nr:uncharacterized protein LOC124913401 [Impatiens glandulifera]
MRAMFQNNNHSSTHNNHEGGQAPVYKQFMTFKPAEFRSSTDPIISEEWVQSMETIFEFMQITEVERVRCATFMLKDDARIWWQGAKVALDLNNITWREFKEVFYGKYFTLSTRNKLEREFLEIKQGDSSIADYVKRFERGKYFAPVITDNASMELNHFLEGLNATIRRDVWLSNPSSMRETIDRALMAEKDNQDIIREAQAKRTSYQGRDSHPRNFYHNNNNQRFSQRPQQSPQSKRVQPAGSVSSAKFSNTPIPVCTICGKTHIGSCIQGSNVCFLCKQRGNIQRDCPKKNEVALGRVFSMTREEANPKTTIITGNL